MAASVNSRGKAITVDIAMPLFDLRPAGEGYFYDVSRDGQSFLVMTQPDPPAETPSITLVVNWTEALKH